MSTPDRLRTAARDELAELAVTTKTKLLRATEGSDRSAILSDYFPRSVMTMQRVGRPAVSLSSLASAALAGHGSASGVARFWFTQLLSADAFRLLPCRTLARTVPEGSEVGGGCSEHPREIDGRGRLRVGSGDHCGQIAPVRSGPRLLYDGARLAV